MNQLLRTSLVFLKALTGAVSHKGLPRSSCRMVDSLGSRFISSETLLKFFTWYDLWTVGFLWLLIPESLEKI
jgi:hypothetical protein